MQEAYGEIRGLGAEVVVISFTPPERLPDYVRMHGWPFPVVADPGRLAYRAFGLGSARWGTLLRPRVWLGYASLMARGYRPRTPGEDVHQLGGDFVVAADRRVVLAHRSTDPADRPPASELLRALRSLSAPPSPPSPRPGGGRR